MQMKHPFYIFLVTITLLVMSTLLDQESLTLLIAAIAAISGWVTVFYQYYSDRPKIKGKILNVMRGKLPNPSNPSETLTTFVLFVYLTNVRKSVVHLRDYILEIDNGNGFERMKIVRGDMAHFHFDTAVGEIHIPDFEQGVIYKQSKPVEFGVPYYGYLMFAGDLKYYNSEIKRFRITCVDVFDHKHKVTAKPSNFVDLFYLQEVFKIKTPIGGIPTVEGTQPVIVEGVQSSSTLISGNEVTSNDKQGEK